ncbi:MAG: hypothetical protein KBS56_03055 [Clostridiales bacterium]|nr:hypothetical protein [Candidatus Crickella equi]
MKKIFTIFLSIVMTIMLAGCGGDANGGATAEITVNKATNVASEAVPELGNLEFEFSDADGNEYSGVIAGMRNSNKMTAEQMNAVVETIGSHFAGGSSARLDSGADCGYDLVDAEKYSGKDNSAVTSGAPYGDANLCWAASTANMLVMTGWNDGMNEDGIMSYFTENFFDEGSYQHSGIKFFFNGVNDGQSAAKNAGKTGAKDATFVENDSAELMSSTQVRNPGKKNGKNVNVGHYTKYAGEAIADKINTSSYAVEDLEKIIIDAIDNGNAVGLAIVFYNGDSRVGVHALTASGYIKTAEGKLAALVIADSDNDIELKKEYGNSAEETESARAERPNSYDMFLTGSFTHNETEFMTLQDYKFSNPKMKYDNAVIQQIAVLRSCKKAGSALESSGTKDGANTPDLILQNAANAGEDINISVKAGKKASIPVIVTNRSYKGYSAKDKPVVKGRLIVKKGDQKVKEEPFEFSLATDSYTTGEANCDFSITLTTKFSDAGKYTVDAEILGVYSGGSKLGEAYTANNYIKNAAFVTVN